MRNPMFVGLLAVGLLGLMPATGHAHGGIYRGPRDIVPPNPGAPRGGSGPGPGPHQPGLPGPHTPNPGPVGPGPKGSPTGGPGGMPPGRNPITGPRGPELEPDFTQWHYWWEFNKDPYLRLKDAVHADTAVSGSTDIYLGFTTRVEHRDSRAPTEAMRRDVILPALKQLIDGTEDNDIASACMVAMAKVGLPPRDFTLRDVFAPRLASPSQELRETAAIAFGIAGHAHDGATELLLDLVGDTPAGRRLCGRAEVGARTRAFAAYGLGLHAHNGADLAAKARTLTAMQAVLSDPSTARDLEVAAIHAIGLLRLDPAAADSRALLDRALAGLEAHYLRARGPGDQLLQAHVPTAVARLLTRSFPDAAVVAHWQQIFVADLVGSDQERRSSRDFARSCALALGQIGAPCDDERSRSAAVVDVLLQQWREHKDQQTRFFSVLALGQIGGRRCRSLLLTEFGRRETNRSIEKPWVAMALGVLAFDALARQRDAGDLPVVDDELGRTLHQALDDLRDPMALSAIAVSLGLAGYRPAGDDLRALLAANQNKDDLAGYLCIGLALLHDDLAREPIRQLLLRSARRPELLRQAAIALGKLGDKSAAESLQDLLRQQQENGGGNLASLAAFAAALGFIGDCRSIEPLRRMLGDTALQPLNRAFAAAALGGVGDKEPLPWNSAIGAHLNYRAAVETLTDQVAGILDIL